MKTEVKQLRTGKELIAAIVEELTTEGTPPTDSAIVGAIRVLDFLPSYPRAEFFVSNFKQLTNPGQGDE